ncbi:MAG: oxaloacetate decarboxylase, partial [Sphingomonadaceae bacterium]
MPSPFQDRVAARQTFWAAGAFDAFSARLIEQAAFDAVFLSGYALSAALLGMPDIGLYTMTENVTALRNVRAAVDLPIVADGDTGYGGILNVQRTVRELAAAGAQAFTLEDQAFPKRCPLIEDAVEDLVSIDEGVSRVRAAVDVARPLGIAVIARTDARGMDEAMARSIAYVAAGADIVQPVGRAFAGIAELRELHARCGVPLSI